MRECSKNLWHVSFTVDNMRVISRKGRSAKHSESLDVNQRQCKGRRRERSFQKVVFASSQAQMMIIKHTSSSDGKSQCQPVVVYDQGREKGFQKNEAPLHAAIRSRSRISQGA